MAQVGDRTLGVRQIVFFVVAAAAPLTGTLGALPVAIGMGAGAGAAVAFLLAAALLIVFSVGFGQMSRHVTEAGAFYAYVARGLGRAAGTGTVLVAVASYFALEIALMGLFGFFCRAIVSPLVPWWGYALAALAAAHLLATRRVDLNAVVLGVLMTVEIGIVLLLVAAIALHAGPAQLSAEAFAPAAILSPGFGIAIMFAFACFVGFEATAIYAAEARDPERTVPRATYASVSLIGVFFAVACWGIANAYGPALRSVAVARPGDLWFDAATVHLGAGGAAAMRLFLLSSIFASILAFQNALARYVQMVARDGYLPAALAQVDPATGSPVAACRLGTMLAAAAVALCVVLRLDPFMAVFGWMSAFATIGILLLQMLVSAAVLRFFRGRATWATAVAPIAAIAGLGGVLVLMIRNLPALAGDESPAIYALPVIQLALLAIGAAWGTRSQPDLSPVAVETR